MSGLSSPTPCINVFVTDMRGIIVHGVEQGVYILSIVISPSAPLLSLVAKLRAASTVVDEPVADLRHANSGRLCSISWLHLVVYKSREHTLENMAFCSSVGYGFVIFCALSAIVHSAAGGCRQT